MHRDRRVGLRSRPSRVSRKSNSPPAASVALVSTTVSSRSKSSLPEDRRQVERDGVQRDVLVPRAVRSIQRTVGGPRRAGRRVRLRPSARGLEPAQHRADLLQQLRPLRSELLGLLSRSAMVSTVSRRRRNARSVSSQRERRAPRPRPDRRRTRRPSRSWPPARPSSRAKSRSEARPRWRAGHRRARAPAARWIRSRLARLSRSLRAVSSLRQRRHQPAAVPLEAAEQPADAAARHLDAEVAGGDVLEVVRLVEDQPLVRRQHRRLLPVVRRPAGSTGRRPGDDDSRRRRRPPPRGAGPGTGSSDRSGGT